MIALLGALAGFAVTILKADSISTPTMQFVEIAQWIPRFNINYHLGVDGISLLFVMLNSFITINVVLAGWQVIGETRWPNTMRPSLSCQAC